MNRPIYCLIFLGLPYFALALSRSGLRAVASRNAVEDLLKPLADQNSLARYANEESNDAVPAIRGKRQQEAAAGATEGSPKPEEQSTETSEAGPAAQEPLPDIRWITYLFLLAIALLFLLLVAVVMLLAYYILSTRVLNKTTCKEIELQCRCDDCDKENEDDDC